MSFSGSLQKLCELNNMQNGEKYSLFNFIISEKSNSVANVHCQSKLNEVAAGSGNGVCLVDLIPSVEAFFRSSPKTARTSSKWPRKHFNKAKAFNVIELK